MSSVGGMDLPISSAPDLSSQEVSESLDIGNSDGKASNESDISTEDTGFGASLEDSVTLSDDAAGLMNAAASKVPDIGVGDSKKGGPEKVPGSLL